MKSQYEQLIQNMPPGIDRAILRVLTFHQGKANAIGRGNLVKELTLSGFRAHERQVREMIKTMRRDGQLICSAPGEDGGYYLAQDKTEFEEFANSEFKSKISDMSETLHAMQAAAAAQFGQAHQTSLF
jgi:DNA-binding transcriptional regulator PaaX